MKKMNTIIFVLALVFVPSVFADEQSHRKLAEELLVTMQVDKQVDGVYDRMKATQKEQMKNMGASEEMMSSQDKMMAMMAKEMSWANLKDDYISAYAEVFSDEDIRGLIDFYKSPVGQKLIAKTPELTSRMMKISQKRIQTLLPQMKEMSNHLVNEMKQKAADKTPSEPMMNMEKK